MYDCSGKEGVCIVVLECGYMSVCQRVMCVDCLRFGVR